MIANALTTLKCFKPETSKIHTISVTYLKKVPFRGLFCVGLQQNATTFHQIKLTYATGCCRVFLHDIRPGTRFWVGWFEIYRAVRGIFNFLQYRIVFRVVGVWLVGIFEKLVSGKFRTEILKCQFVVAGYNSEMFWKNQRSETLFFVSGKSCFSKGQDDL